MKISSRLRTVTLIGAVVLPWPVKKLVYRWIFGWTIEQGASIGLAIITARRVHLGRGARVGHFTVVRDLPQLCLGTNAAIGQWNWITCGDMFMSGAATIPPPKEQGLFMGPNAAITSRHYIDCPGGVFVGDYAVVAGVRSSLITHYVDFETSTMVCKPIRIGTYSYIGSDVKLTPGAMVPDFSVVGMGAVVTGVLTEERTLFAGVPARPIRPIGDGEFFRREDRRAR